MQNKTTLSKMNAHYPPVILFLLLIIPRPAVALFDWRPFSSADPPSSPPPEDRRADFSIELFTNANDEKALEEAKTKIRTLNSCWQEAYNDLFSSCSEIISNEEKHSRLAWRLSDCFIRDSGRQTVPSCSLKSAMKDCRKKLSDFEQEIYLQFFIQTNSLCHQLQAGAFKRDTERLVNELKRSAQAARDALASIEERSEILVESSSKIQDSLMAVESHTQNLMHASVDVEAKISEVMEQSLAISMQNDGIRVSQGKVLEAQMDMREKLESGITVLQESYESLGIGMEKIRVEAAEMGNQINEVGDLMNKRMTNLQETADDIGRIAVTSLDNQKELVKGQSRALEELKHLTKFQSDALEESRIILENLVEFGKTQQEELIRKQEHIEAAQNRLFQNSQSILAAQEEFENKQANIFTALEKLFVLHNAILLESRFIKCLFYYSCAIFLLYMLTSTKQTFNVRARLYLGLCITFIIEIATVRFGENGLHQQTRVASRVSLLRSAFLIAAAVQILYSIITYRDYEILNHRLLQRLAEKIDAIEQKTDLLSWSDNADDDFVGYSWIEQELPEEVNVGEDPDYASPEDHGLAASCGRKYELRPRRQR